MKRQRFQTDRLNYGDDAVPLSRVTTPKQSEIIAQVQNGDTLQAICLRYNCSLADLKRLNKIEKEIEIHARTTLRIPVTPYTVLVETRPGVHSSGNSSPKHATTSPSHSDLLLNNNLLLDEKLFIASVSNASSPVPGPSSTINDIILESKIESHMQPYHDVATTSLDDLPRDIMMTARVPLLSGELDDNVPQPRPIPVRHRFEVNFNGTDCDMSWVCLFICILLLCVAIPLIYVFWTVEHKDHLHHQDDGLHNLVMNSSQIVGQHESKVFRQ